MQKLVFRRRPLAAVTAVLAATVLGISTGGCRHVGNAADSEKSATEPPFAVVRAKLKQPLDEYMASYVVTRVLWSDRGIRANEEILVFCRDGTSISSQSQPLGGVIEWPADAMLALVKPDKPMYSPDQEFWPVTSRWEYWIAPASDLALSAFAALPRERLRKAYEREIALEERAEETREEARRSGETIRQVVDADSDVSDHAVLSIVVQHGHSRRHPSLVVAIWPSGRMVWGKDLSGGGSPYRQGYVPKDALSAFRRRLTESGIMDGSAFGRGGMCVVSGSSTDIRILWDGASVRTGSSRGLYPHAGDGESPEFVKAWETLKDEVRKLVPDESVLLPEYDFQILEYPVPPRTGKPEAQ